jgi:trimeric autotransporter adhesin
MLKKFIQSALLLVVLFTTATAYAQIGQSPDGIQFQALATDANGHPAAGRVIYVKDAIVAKTATGTIVYSETFKVTASSAGIFTIVLGKGTYAGGVSSIANIDWANGPFFLNLKIAVEPTVPNAGWNANNEYVDLGTSQFWSVPYALYAGSVKGLDTKLNIADTAAMLKPYFTAINLKANIESPTFTGTVSGITKAMVGLGNVDNTSDLNKPISTATQAALALKANAADVTTSLALKANAADVTTSLALKANAADVTTSLALKANAAGVTTSLALKANAADVTTSLALKANATDVTTALALKANAADVTTALDLKVDKVTGKALSTNDYTTAEKTKLAAITGTNTGDQDLSALAVAADVNAGLALKANTADVNAALALKANAANVASSLAAKADVVNVNNAIAAINTSLNTKADAVAVNNSVAALNTSLDTKENASNKSLNIVTDGASDVKYPSVKSVKTYVDAQIAGATIADADANTKGKIQLAGDLGGSAAAPTVPGLALKANTSDVNTSLSTKVDKVSGKDLSTNDYTTAEKDKLAAITGTNTGDQVNITGNAGTATKLQNARTINGIAFDGSSDITLPAPAAGIPYTGATQAADLGAFNLTVMTVNGITIGRGLNGNTNSNIAIGNDVLRSVTGGSYLTAVGHEALYSNTTGYNNTAVGSGALKANIGGLANTAIGSNSLQSNTTANFVTAVGNHALRNNTTGGNNTAVGSGALEFNSTGELNSAFGYDALKKNTTGIRNTAVGVNTLLENTTGNDNTATGFGALLKNTTGSRNTANGWYALALNTTGTDNTAFGYTALYPNTTGTLNTAVGQGALKNNSTGNENSALGEGTLANNTTGNYNSAFGRESLHNSNGNNNTAIGWRAGFQNGSNNTAVGFQAGYTAGNNNTAIGASADFAANVTDATAIGYGARANGNNATAIGNGAVAVANTIRLGNSTVTTIGGQVAWTAASDSRIKKNIVNSNYGLTTVLKLRPVEYNLISNDLKQVGFIAQEVQKLVPEVVTGKEGDLNKGEILGITYSNLVPVLTKAIQEQQKQIEDQNAKIAAQQKQIEELIKLMKELKK